MWLSHSKSSSRILLCIMYVRTKLFSGEQVAKRTVQRTSSAFHRKLLIVSTCVWKPIWEKYLGNQLQTLNFSNDTVFSFFYYWLLKLISHYFRCMYGLGFYLLIPEFDLDYLVLKETELKQMISSEWNMKQMSNFWTQKLDNKNMKPKFVKTQDPECKNQKPKK
jgi:hypothetical protein